LRFYLFAWITQKKATAAKRLPCPIFAKYIAER